MSKPISLAAYRKAKRIVKVEGECSPPLHLEENIFYFKTKSFCSLCDVMVFAIDHPSGKVWHGKVEDN